MDDQQFRQLLEHFGYSWEGYRKVRKGVKKRISRHMQQLGCRTIDDYLHALDNDGELRKRYECLMTVSVSRFFRDRFLWKLLEDRILPRIIGGNPNTLKVWFGGCACGEEVYTLKMLWASQKARLDAMPKLVIWATDLNSEYLRRAQAGIYPSSSIKEVPQDLRQTHFIFRVKDGLYRIAPFVKEGIVWKVHNLLFELGEYDFQIIFLRNSVLTYYKDELRQSAFLKALACLAQGGFLIIGSHERLPIASDSLVPVSSQPYIFRKIEK